MSSPGAKRPDRAAEGSAGGCFIGFHEILNLDLFKIRGRQFYIHQFIFEILQLMFLRDVDRLMHFSKKELAIIF